jgi:anti-sigma factor RsiW
VKDDKREGCEQMRLDIMALLDGEATWDGEEAVRVHLENCEGCRAYRRTFLSLSSRIEAVAYPSASVDLWDAVKVRIATPRRPLASNEARTLLMFGGFALAWRAGQLLLDPPFALVLSALVPLAAAAVALWKLAGNPITIEMSMSEVERRHA